VVRPGVRVGVDVGSVRIGVALCDPEAVLATPCRTVARAGARSGPGGTSVGAGQAAPDSPDVEELAAIVDEERAVEVVVGLPRTLAGTEGAAAQAAREYARRLAVRLAPVPVRLLDERLTTVDAHRGLRESGLVGRRHRGVVDQAAAVLILQAALDAERATGRPPGELLGSGRRKPRTKDGHR
jgi:putative Holliday junction resolvase